MAQVTLPLVCVNAFDLPPVCVVTGASDDIVWRKTKVRYTPPWVFALILVHIVVAAVVGTILSRKATLELPYAREAYRSLRRHRIILLVASCLSVVLLIGGFMLTWATENIPLGVTVMLGPLIATILYGAIVVSPRTPRARSMTDTHVTLRARSGAFVSAVMTTLPAAGWAAGQMGRGYAAPPAGAYCAQHPDADAEFLCGRCGDFLCRPCAQWVPVSDRVLCEGCGQRRLEHLASLGVNDPGWAYYGQPPPRNRVATTGLWCAILGLIPFLVICAAAAVVCSIIGLVQASRLGVGRAAAIWGLVLGLAGIGGFVALITLA